MGTNANEVVTSKFENMAPMPTVPIKPNRQLSVTTSNKRVAIVGGGPVGLEAAIYGVCAGFDVHLYERGRIAENIRQWGYIRLFTDWRRNHSPLAARLLRERNIELAPDDARLSGDEMAEYVLRLTALPMLRGRVHPQTEVAAISREACLKSDFPDSERRADYPFRLLLRGIGGEKLAHADAVLDAGGVYATPNWLGSGGAPCVGEEPLQRRIIYHLPDVENRDRALFANRHTLLVGSGHSAASTLLAICALRSEFPQTRVSWIVRRAVPHHGLPYTIDPNDETKHRQELHQNANGSTSFEEVDFRPRTVVEKIEYTGAKFRVLLSTRIAPRGSTLPAGEAESWETSCDTIVGHTGFRAETSLWRELQVPVHPVTGGVAPLSEALLEQNRRVGVGLSTGYAHKEETESTPASQKNKDARIDNPELMRLPEPDFYVVGIKSYGRDAGFLLQNGFRQIRDVYKLISGDAQLDLYEGALDE